jgi:hypothetical protein
VASFLTSQGYQAFALQGGYMAWYKAGYPIARKQATAALPWEMVCPDCGEPLEKHADHESSDTP